MSGNTNKLTTNLPRVRRALHAWYRLHGRRDLPWRTTRDPYHVYISEIMLQQTQVSTVLARYYGPFLTRFPTIAALAKAPLQDVLKAWEGLGYYTRARNLHAAAKLAGKALPNTVEGLLALPGIGRNTAHAVASFGFNLPVPVMEANVKRVLCRVFALTHPDDKTLWECAEKLLDRHSPFDHNQAMMDVGALICLRRKPRCAECPLAAICTGKAHPERYPAAKQAKQTKIREKNIAVLQDDKGRVYVEQRTTRFLGGLFGFPEYDRDDARPEFGGKKLAFAKNRLLIQVTQVYSHFTLQAQVYLLKVGKVKEKQGEGGIWVTPETLATLPLSRADSKIAAMLALL